MPGVAALTIADVEWAVDVLAARRTGLTPFAPVLWRPASGARERHAAFLHHVLDDGGGVGVRTDDGLMIAASGPDGWVVDDTWVPHGRWATEGLALWEGLTARLGTVPASVICPTPEVERVRFVLARGLRVGRSWWHRPVGGTTAGPWSTAPRVDGATAALVEAPPIYDPGGPVLFLREVTDDVALDEAPRVAGRCGSPLVVVEHPVDDADLAAALEARGFVRHCDFLSPPPAAARRRRRTPRRGGPSASG